MEGEVKEAFEKIGQQKDYDGGHRPPERGAGQESQGFQRALPDRIELLQETDVRGGHRGLGPGRSSWSRSFLPAHFELAVCYQKQGRKKRPSICYQKTLELDPGNPDAAYNAGLILFGLNRVDEALANFERALKVKPGDPEYLEMAGRCYINQGNFAKAIEYLEQVKGAPDRPGKDQVPG